MRKKKLWVYEYKDNDTPIGATLLNVPLEELEMHDPVKFPHLQEPWHWRMEVTYEEEDED